MKKVYIEKGGIISVKDEPEPDLKPRYCITDTQYSLISAGTESHIISTFREEGAKGNGLRRIGYSNSGIVRETGAEIEEFKPGDLVSCYGGRFADHQSVCSMPRTLVASCPEGVTARQAAFGGVATFGLNGLRLCGLSFGEVVAVIGLGLIGQITAQIVRAAGYRAVGITHSDYLIELAEKMGINGCIKAGNPDTAEKAVDAAVGFGGAKPARGRAGGFDAALICTGRDNDNESLILALDIIRNGGAVSIVGGVKHEFPRDPFFARQARLLIARAAGTGRYDPVYEDEANLIPHSHVRWTEGRNLGEVMRMIGDGKLNVDSLISHEYPVDQAPEAYDLIVTHPKDYLGVLLSYTE